MADVIRRAIIEIETRQKRSRLDAPGVGEAGRAFKAEEAAATKAAAAVEKVDAASRRHADTVRVSSLTAVRGFHEMGEGALRAARGMALLSAGGSDDLKKLIQTVALAQGAFDVFAGSFKAITHAGRAFGPVGAAITGITHALGLGVAAWVRWEGASREAARAAADAREELRKYEVEQIRIANRQAAEEQRSGAEIGDMRIRFSSDADRLRAIERELAAERRRSAELASEEAFLRHPPTPDLTPLADFGMHPTRRRVDVRRRGGEKGRLEHRSGIADRQEQSVRRQLELLEQQKQIQEEQLRETHRSRQDALGNVTSFLGGPNTLAGSVVSQFGNAVSGGLEQQMREFYARHSRLVNEQLTLLEQIEARQREFKDQQQRSK
jgi:hypothetical protein